MTLNIDNAKSYATEKNLLEGLKKLGFENERFVVVLNRQHRFTAIFPAPQNGNIAVFAQAGFITIG